MLLLVLRAGVLVLALTALSVALQNRQRCWRRLVAFFNAKLPAYDLALLRIIVFSHLLRSTLRRDGSWYSGLPPELIRVPWGYHWLRPHLPLDPGLVSQLEVVLIVACCCAIAGVFTRVSCAVSACLALLLLGLPNFYLKMHHGEHLAVLCAIVLSFAPAGDALSIDQAVRRLRGAPSWVPSSRYALPVRWAMLLLATTYLFPGLWKLWVSGDQWMTGVKVRAETLTKWSTLPDFDPTFPWVVDSTVLSAAFGILTLVFEVGFVFALFSRAGRYLAAASAIAFHLGVRLTMGITFPLYLPLIAALSFGEAAERGAAPRASRWALAGGRLRDWAESTIARLRRHVPSAAQRTYPAQPTSPSLASWVSGAALVLAMCWAGLARIESWPVAVYPRFSSRVGQAPNIGRVLDLTLERGERVIELGSSFGRLDKARSSILAYSILNARKEQRKLQRRLRLGAAVVYHGWCAPQPGDVLTVTELKWSLDRRRPRTFRREPVAALKL